MAVLLAAELLALVSYFRPRVGSQPLQPFVIMFVAAFFGFGVVRYPKAFRKFAADTVAAPLGWKPLGGHIAAALVLVAATAALQFGHPNFRDAALLMFVWYTALFLAIACAVDAFVPWQASLDLVRNTGHLLISAFAIAALGMNYAGGGGFRTKLLPLMHWLTQGTLLWVAALLRLVLPGVVVDPANRIVGTPVFHVYVADSCSGVEGLLLVAAFSIGWLVFLRKEFRFPRALLMIPAGMALAYFLNSVRLAALIMIGHLGHPAVAMIGFHTAAGWILFTANVLSLSYVAQFRWFQRDPVSRSTSQSLADDPTAAYLLPFLAILGMAMIGRAASGGFELLYPLRVAGAAIALWMFRKKYRELNWRVHWHAVAAGVAVFAMWMGLDSLSGDHSGGAPLAAGLAGLSPIARGLWLAVRTLGAAVTVPIAEELAFRGYALRRIVSADFESVNWRTFTWPALLLSSLVFGSMHGGRWIAGTIAGAIYAATMLHKGSIGDAAVAHASTNALLAVWVISQGAWWLW